jgi:hypothetical protein
MFEELIVDVFRHAAGDIAVQSALDILAVECPVLLRLIR